MEWDVGGGEDLDLDLEEFGITPPRGVRREAAERSRRRRDEEATKHPYIKWWLGWKRYIYISFVTEQIILWTMRHTWGWKPLRHHAWLVRCGFSAG